MEGLGGLTVGEEGEASGGGVVRMTRGEHGGDGEASDMKE